MQFCTIVENSKKMKALNNNIAIVFDDLTEFYVMQKAIDKLKESHYQVDIIVPYDSGYNNLAEHTLQTITNLGYSPLDDAPSNKTYKILLTPYPGLDAVKRIKYIYHLRYPYGAISAKPNPSYYPNHIYQYDAMFSFNTYDGFLETYGPKIYPLPYWRYTSFKRKPQSKNQPPILLLLPTFGTDTSFINHLPDSTITELKKEFKIISKAHHAVHFGIDGADTLQRLEQISDEFYTSDTPIDDLLKKATIVLSDNSGAIFESICANVPIAIFTNDPNSRHLGKLNTLQYKLVQQKIIPHATKPNEILPMLHDIKPFIKKQKAIREKLFITNSKKPFDDFISIIKHYIEADEDQDSRRILHNLFLKELIEQEKTIDSLKQENEKLTKANLELTQYITDIHNSTSWKITSPIRKLKLKGNTNAQK